MRRKFSSALLIALLVTLALVPMVSAQTRTFSAQLSAAEEVPTNASTATGQATYTLSDDGMTLHYKLTVTNIKNPFMAHIHTGAKGANGPVVLPLFSAAPNGGVKNGTLIEGDVTAAQLSGPMAGKTMADLMAEVNAGNTYTNIHTNDGADPANSGPGDLAGGEIRGQNTASAPGLPNTGAGGTRSQQLPPAVPALALVLGIAALLGFETRRRVLGSR
jgi:hypothetical protein